MHKTNAFLYSNNICTCKERYMCKNEYYLCVCRGWGGRSELTAVMQLMVNSLFRQIQNVLPISILHFKKMIYCFEMSTRMDGKRKRKRDLMYYVW